MKLPDDHPIHDLDQAIGYDPETNTMPGQKPESEDVIEGRRLAYLTRRGQRVATATGLGQVDAHDLVALGRLAVLGDHPAIGLDLATDLEAIAEARDINPHPSFRQDRDRHQGHHHAINVTCTMPTPAQALETPTPDDPDIDRSSVIDRGQVDHHRAEVRKTRRDDPLKDHPGEEWTS